MKKLILIFIFNIILSINLIGQIRNENVPVIKYVDSVVGKHVTFVSWYTENDTIKVNQIRIWDFEKKEYVDFFENDIKKLFPILFRGFTIKVNLPLSSTNWSHIINFDLIDTVKFLNRTYFMDRVAHFRRKYTPWEIFT